MTDIPTPFPHIFVSHSSQDNDFVIQLVVDLRRVLGDATAVWYNSRGEEHGEVEWNKIVEELMARHVFILVLSPDALASPLVRHDGKVRIWDAISGRLILTYRGHDHWLTKGVVDTLAWSPDGRYLASGGQDNTVQIWQAG